MSKQMMTLTDGRNTMEIPFREGEMTLAALKRAVKIFSPCQGNGTCGRCIIEVLQPDGSYKRELACRYPAREMTVRLPAPAPGRAAAALTLPGHVIARSEATRQSVRIRYGTRSVSR